MRPVIRFELRQALLLWALLFCYSTSAALIVQKLLLPFIPSIHAGHGLLTHDAALFHTWALEVAESIKTVGWQSWSLFPPPSAAGNVAILGALYALFGPDPSVMIPLNAAVHALGGILIYFLGRQLWPGKIGTVGGVIGAVLFVTFPSSLTWYGQVHKDAYAIAGLLMLLLVWLRIASARGATDDMLRNIGLAIGGVLLIGIVRPYFLVVVFAASLLISTIIVASEWLTQRQSPRRRRIDAAVAVVLILAVAAWAGSKVRTPAAHYGEFAMASAVRDSLWHRGTLLPSTLEHFFEKAARMRVGLIKEALEANAGSTIDADRTPDSVAAVVAYLPRALQIALLAPFPTTWLERPNLMRLVGTAETLLWYLLIPGVIVTLVKRFTLPMLICVVYCVFFLCVLGFIHANVGTLYRYRYPFLFPLILAGVMGWLYVLSTRIRSWRVATAGSIETRTSVVPDSESSKPSGVDSRRRAATSGALVMALTLVAYLGFFVRDVLMTRLFGMADDLDAFYLAMLAPTFLASVLAFPIGEASIPAFLAIRNRMNGRLGEANAFSQHMAFLTLVCFVILGIGVALTGGLLLPVFSRQLANPDTLRHAVALLNWTVPLLMLSALSVLGYSLLSGLGKPVLGSAAQLVVPIIAMVILLAFAHLLGVASAGLGMVLGQIASIWVVYICLRGNGISLLPRWHRGNVVPASLPREYGWLTLAALCAYASVPVNYYFVSFLQGGSIAAWAIGSKVVLFFTGAISAALTAVILPYFSRITAKDNSALGKKELRALLGAGSALAILFSTVIFLGSEPLVRLVFEGKRFSAADVHAVSQVVRYGIVQLPFFVITALLFKFAIASKQSWQVVAGTVVGAALNVLLDIALVGRMGISGVALATALSVGVSSAIVLAVAAMRGAITWLSVVVMAMCWLLFLSLIVCLHYASYPGAVVSVIALAVILSAYLSEPATQQTAVAPRDLHPREHRRRTHPAHQAETTKLAVERSVMPRRLTLPHLRRDRRREDAMFAVVPLIGRLRRLVR